MRRTPSYRGRRTSVPLSACPITRSCRVSRSGTHADALPLRSTTADVALRGDSTAVFGQNSLNSKGVRTHGRALPTSFTHP
jgi:hypothetical protein